jgi:hypothetical protein
MGRAMARWLLLACVATAAGCLQIIGFEDARPGWVSCADGVKDENETDVDCGGSCAPCATGKSCVVGGDCESHVCTGGTCIAPSCSDKVQNEGETDVDCGGKHCAGCSAGKMCVAGSDCKSGVCTGGKCQPTCKDGEKDGDETDVDCGGNACPACADGKVCKAGTDCQSAVCRGGVCQKNLVWAKDIGAIGSQQLVADTTGRLLLTGVMIGGTVNFGDGPMMPTMGSVFVTAFDTGGNVLWHNISSELVTRPTCISTDSAGNVLLGGSFGGDIGFDNWHLTSVSSDDAFLAKFSSTGKASWIKQWGDTSMFHVVTSVATDASQNIVITGLFTGTINFGGNDLVSAGGMDGFLVKLDPSGNHTWSMRFGTVGDDAGNNVVIDADGNVILSANTFNGVDFGGGPLAADPHDYAFGVAKYDPNGHYLWAHLYRGVSPTAQVDANKNIVLAGSFSNTLDLGSISLVSAGGTDVLVAGLDPTGTLLWAKSFGDTADQDVSGFALDAAGNLVITGAFGGNVDFGGGPLSSSGMPHIFLATLDPHGNYVWDTAFGGPDGQSVVSLAADGAGSAYVAGNFSGDIGLSGLMPGPTPPATPDAFLAKFLVP